MPYERKYKRKYRRRKRRPRRTGTISTLSQSASPMPASFITKHKYVESFTLDAGISSPASHIFHAIGMYDPNITGTGHQPLGFDQIQQFYDHYTVLGAKITVRFFSGGDTIASGAMMCSIYTNDDSTPIGTYDTIMEQSKGVHRPLTTLNAYGSTTVSYKFSTKKFFGVTDVKDNNQLKGTASSNPSDGAYFIVQTQNISSAQDPSPVYCNATIEYIALWSERRDLSQS